MLMVAVPILLNACGGGNSQQSDLDAVLAEARAKLAPDSRVAVCNVSGEISFGDIILRGEVQDPAMKGAIVSMVRGRMNFPVVDSIHALPDPALGAMLDGVVSVSVANMRTSPSDAAELCSQAILGTQVKFLKKKQGWTFVQTPDGYLGWTDDDIQAFAGPEFAEWQSAPKVIVTARQAWVRSALMPESRPVADVVAGSILAMAGREFGSVIVKLPDGRQGYLDLREAAPLNEWLGKTKGTRESVLAWAYSLMGVPYLWGGTSTKAMDCSGFTRTVFLMNGILLPRDASQQALVGDQLLLQPGKVDLIPGDLLFFGVGELGKKSSHVTHVGISLGGARFIHESGRVRINSLDPGDADYSAVRARSYLGARRIIGAMESSGVKHLSSMTEYR
jgi:hypothetical protein